MSVHNIIEISEDEYLKLHYMIDNYQNIMLEILDILASEEITASGSMYQKGRYDLAKKIYSRIEKEIER